MVENSRVLRYPDGTEKGSTYFTIPYWGFNYKKGVLYLSTGYAHTNVFPESLDTFEASIFSADYTWDGNKFWTERGVTETDLEKLPLIKAVYESYPDIPENYKGWYVSTGR